MVLITCPECGHQVSDTAEACPQCGYAILKDKIQIHKTRKIRSNDPYWIQNVLNGHKKKGKVILIISAILLLVAIAFLILLFADQDKQTKGFTIYMNFKQDYIVGVAISGGLCLLMAFIGLISIYNDGFIYMDEYEGYKIAFIEKGKRKVLVNGEETPFYSTDFLATRYDLANLSLNGNVSLGDIYESGVFFLPDKTLVIVNINSKNSTFKYEPVGIYSKREDPIGLFLK